MVDFPLSSWFSGPSWQETRAEHPLRMAPKRLDIFLHHLRPTLMHVLLFFFNRSIDPNKKTQVASKDDSIWRFQDKDIHDILISLPMSFLLVNIPKLSDQHPPKQHDHPQSHTGQVLNRLVDLSSLWCWGHGGRANGSCQSSIALANHAINLIATKRCGAVSSVLVVMVFQFL